MAAQAAQAAARLVDALVDGVRTFASTGDLGLALARAADAVLDALERLLGDREALRYAAVVAGLAMISVGTVMVLEDIEDFLTDWSRFHHWMLGLLLILAGVAVIALAA